MTSDSRFPTLITNWIPSSLNLISKILLRYPFIKQAVRVQSFLKVKTPKPALRKIIKTLNISRFTTKQGNVHKSLRPIPSRPFFRSPYSFNLIPLLGQLFLNKACCYKEKCHSYSRCKKVKKIAESPVFRRRILTLFRFRDCHLKYIWFKNWQKISMLYQYPNV